MVVINIHASLRRFTDQQEVIAVKGVQTLSDVFEKLFTQFSGLKAVLFDDNGSLKPYILIYVDGNNFQNLSLTTPIDQNVQIDILTALVGG